MKEKAMKEKAMSFQTSNFVNKHALRPKYAEINTDRKTMVFNGSLLCPSGVMQVQLSYSISLVSGSL